MASKNKKRKRSFSPEPAMPDHPPIQKFKFKTMPQLPPDSNSSSKKKSSKKRKQEFSPLPTTSVSPTGDWGEDDGGLKMKFILSPKKTKVDTSPESDATEERSPPPKGTGKGKKKGKQIKAKLFFEDQVLTLDGEEVTHQDVIKPGKKRKAGIKHSPEDTKSTKKKKDADKAKVKEEPTIPPFTKVPKSADKSKIKSIKAESDSGYSDTPTTSAKSKKLKTKLQTLEEQPVPSPQASDVSRDSLPKKKKKEKDKKKKKMFKFKGDRNRFLNVRGSSDEEGGDDSFSRSIQDEDSLGGGYDLEDEYDSNIQKVKSKEMDRFMMPQMPVPDYNLEKQAAESYSASTKAKSKKDDRNEGEIQSSRAEDLISQLTAFGSDMETIYPSYMMAPDENKELDDGGWIKKKKKKKKLAKEKKKKKKKPNLLERDEHGNVKYVMRKTKLSGYMLWCRSYRSTFVSQNPGLDFSTISRRMGALWQTLDEEEKKLWRKREITVNTKVPLKRLNKGKDGASSSAPDAPPFRLKTPDKPKPKVKKLVHPVKRKIHTAAKKKINAAPVKITPPKWNPIDCAAYLRLLGESLSDVGGKLQTHRDNIEVHGSVSVLLDSMLCALGPLLCLTEQVPELNAINKKTKTGVLDNIAYIMPGL
ncbi:HMG box-containing protein 4 isoform X2 [Strongylocentrotus purpuratus]|uniref:HMG box domain-containing protein n=1 Tax=Strongylocentrotus purpuratus TaxID=7668 RepID=A0A7M7RCR7_STRPU|nr:HMG box-containing protein 4 isoform X2 [Strongylocentrotus purpuratus]|eukprot:XP_780797.3 PREDICTED: HMG box-containing protein 4 isoform X2 [Strongylocentrotus purpuratus]